MKNLKVKGIVFDLDGTLTIPNIDFSRMRSLLNIPGSGDILKIIHQYPYEKQQEAFKIIEKVEAEAYETLQFQPGLFETINALMQKNLHLGILTRNSRKCTEIFLQKFSLTMSHSCFDPIVTRETQMMSRDDECQVKPHPFGLLHISKSWNIDPREDLLMVGDHFVDVQCGKAAGCATCLLSESYPTASDSSIVEKPDFVIKNLKELIDILE